MQNAAFKLLLQQDAAAIGTIGDAFDLPEDLQRLAAFVPAGGTGLLLAKGHRFPVRIEATPEETAGDRVETGQALGRSCERQTGPVENSGRRREMTERR